VGDHHADHIFTGQLRLKGLPERAPDGPAHVLAVDLGDLDGLQWHASQLRHCVHELRHRQLRCAVLPALLRVMARTRDGPARSQNHNAFHKVLHATPSACIKVLDKPTVLYKMTANDSNSVSHCDVER
jgi:hypothetical protein